MAGIDSLPANDIRSDYRRSRVLFERPDWLAHSTVSVFSFVPHLVRFVVFLLLQALLGFLAGISVLFEVIYQLSSLGSQLASTSPSDPFGSGAGSPDFSLGFFGVLLILLGVVQLVLTLAFLVSLFLPVREPISEFGVLVDGAAAEAGRCHIAIQTVLERREAPTRASVKPAAGAQVLELQSQAEAAAIIVEPYGADLYVGWTLWRRRSTVMLVIHLVRDVLESLRTSAAASDVRLATTRAFRELIHSATQDGLAAVSSSSVPRPPKPATASDL